MPLRMMPLERRRKRIRRSKETAKFWAWLPNASPLPALGHKLRVWGTWIQARKKSGGAGTLAFGVPLEGRAHITGATRRDSDHKLVPLAPIVNDGTLRCRVLST